MAYRSLIRREVQRALTTGGYLKDLPSRVEYLSASSAGVFDPTLQSSSPDAPAKAVDVVFVEYQVQQVDGVNILAEDKQALLSDLNRIKAGLPIPVSSDKLIELSGGVWVVVSVQTDTAEACWVLQVRKP